MSNKLIFKKLLELSKRAKSVKSDSRLRHSPNEHDIQLASENANFMQESQFLTISPEGSEN
jgi:hypothetical protein